MKKTLAIILSLTMLMSTLAFAAPSAVATVDKAEEKTETITLDDGEAALASDDDNAPVKSKFYRFKEYTTNGMNLNGVENVTVENGVVYATSKSSNPYDPQFQIWDTFKADDYGEVRIRMKWDGDTRYDKDGNEVAPFAQLFYYGTDADGNVLGWSQTNSTTAAVSLDSDGYQVVKFPLTNSNLAGATISCIRIDPINTSGTFYFDYVMIVPKNQNPDIVYTFDDGISPWGYNSSSRITVSAGDGVLKAVLAHNGGAIVNSSLKYLGADYPTAYIRMKMTGLTANRNSLFYTDLVDKDGNSVKTTYATASDGYSYASSVAYSSNNGNYVNYTYNFSGYESYLNNYITTVGIVLAQQADLEVDVDAIVLKNKNNFEWDFDITDLWEGWAPSSITYNTTSNDSVIFTTTADDDYVNPRMQLSGLNIDANRYAGAEVVMKHECYVDASKKPRT